ncbi:uncharacterized protein LOC131170228 [Hevea brasiliensis]|uniref:uncharacterized protein LOC131170228 n=1 Tax=Hevea brasiliensis TaxID=3981 RepID=UPI0025E5CE9E|nr:uncharacterized protein LOC131170228 [Hevea brasiliensis]
MRPVKQKKRRLRPEWEEKIAQEVKKLIEADFIEVIEYPEWLANIVPVPKKDGRVQMCVDYRDLNKATPKDDFPLPHIDVLVDSAACMAMYSFMDGFSGYNQILMDLIDKAKIAFITKWGTYCYKVMPFGLKNASATYQRMATMLFHDMMHKEVKVYVYDMLLRKNQPVVWNEQCQEAFEKIKQYLSNPPILSPPIPSIPLILYLSVENMALGVMLAQEVENLERAIYYISKKLLAYEENYSLIERTCLAIVWATKKLRHYFQTHRVIVVSRMDPLKYLFEVPTLVGKLAKWLVLLCEFDIVYETRKTIKGRVVAEFLSENPVNEGEEVETTFPDESLKLVEVQPWKMYFDGAMNKSGAGIGVVLEALNGEQLLMSKRLCFPTTNNIAEYEACICGLESLIAVGAKKVEVFGDSMLVVSHVKGEWELKEEKLRPYLEYAKKLLFSFEEVTMKHMPRAQNQMADALAMLASLWEKGDQKLTQPVILMRSRIPCYEGLIIAHLDLEDEMKLYEDIRRYLEVREYPQSANSRDRATIRRLATQFTLAGGQLYKRFFEGLLLLCVTKKRSEQIMEEVHAGVCGPHMKERVLAGKILRLGYYWSTMDTDCAKFVKRCHECQIHGNLNHLPSSELYSMTSPWPFSIWGIDIIGKISLTASNGHRFIIVAINYFTKWVEAESYKVVGAKQISGLLKECVAPLKYVFSL